MKKKYFRIILLLLFTVIISQKTHSQEIDFYVNEEKEKVVLPTFHNIELAFTDLNFAYNIKSKYGYTEAKDKGLFEKKTNNSYYAIKTSSEQLAFHCLPIDKKKTNGVTLSVILMVNVFGSGIFATIEGR